MKNFKSIFPVILRIFDLKYQAQTSFEVGFVIFGLVFIKFRKIKSLHWENKDPDLQFQLNCFHSLCHSLYYRLNVFKRLFWISDWRHQIGIWERSFCLKLIFQKVTEKITIFTVDSCFFQTNWSIHNGLNLQNLNSIDIL